MVILYEIIKMITFPGALLKGFLEHLFCRLWKVPVEYSDYMQRNELCGHVEHLLAPHKGSFAICFGPHIIMALLGCIIAFPGAMNLFYIGTFNWLSVILLYVGVSFLSNAFPLVEDALNMWSELFSEESKGISKVLWLSRPPSCSAAPTSNATASRSSRASPSRMRCPGSSRSSSADPHSEKTKRSPALLHGAPGTFLVSMGYLSNAADTCFAMSLCPSAFGWTWTTKSRRNWTE
ncbi:MAG: hypothetical protein IJC96_07975 [Clostridia bacterium]|nr:hypothetical protein [Clostridia bacterium]